MKRNSAVRWQKQWRDVLIRLGLMSLCLALLACGQPKSATAPGQPSWLQVLRGNVGNTPQTPEQAKQWLDTELHQMHSIQVQPEISRLNQQLQNQDRRLIRSIGLDASISDNVFTAVSGASEKKISFAPERSSGTQAPRAKAYDLGVVDIGRVTPAAQPTAKPVATIAPDLSQADAEQIQYVGMIQTDTQYFGLVRVGERVYRVVPNMRIGRGQWRVLQLDATKMQVLINGQTVHYEK